MRSVTLLLSVLLLLACGSPAETVQEEATLEAYYDANEAAGVDVAAAQGERDGRADPGAAMDDSVLAFDSLKVGPDTVTVEDEIWAEARLTAGSSAFADVEYTWTVNGREVMGVTKGTLDVARGRFKKGDEVHVVASAIDEKGRIANIESDRIVIANGLPRILTDASRRSGIDGVVMKAEDPDGDELAWSILQGPPGVSIDRRGMVHVDQVNLDEAFAGEVVVAATDPDGARAEFHVPVSINAAVEEVVEERTTTTRRHRDEMTEEEYERINIEGAEQVMEMSEEEFEAHSREEERREEERRKSGDR